MFTSDPNLGSASILTVSRLFYLFPVSITEVRMNPALGTVLPLAHRRGVGSLQGP